MDLQAKILELESKLNNLTNIDAIRGNMQNEMRKTLDFLHEEIQHINTRKREDDERYEKHITALWGWVENFKTLDKYVNESLSSLRERVSVIFYKVFPEAELADEALERAVQAARAERKNKPAE